MKRLIKKANNDEIIDNIIGMIYFWSDGGLHFHYGGNKFIAGERFEEDIENAKRLYPEAIYNGTCYRFITINGSEIGDNIEGLTYDRSTESIIVDDSKFNGEFSSNSLLFIKQNLIQGYGIYQAFSKDENFSWGWHGGAALGIKITLNNANGLDFIKISELLNKTSNLKRDEQEVIARLREDIDIRLEEIF